MTFPKTKRRKQRNERINSEENEDRLSDLPDGVLLHILSFLNAKDVVRSCILSTRWKHLWKRIPTLKLSASHFSTLKGFNKFVSRVLSLRDGSTALHDLDFHRIGSVESRLLKRMGFVFRGGDDGRAEPFSTLKRLNSLTIDYCQVVDAKTLCISSTTLVNLTIHGSYIGDYSTIELHAPSLCLFAFTGTPFQKLSGSHLSSIQQVNIDADMVSKIKPPLVPLSWLIQLPNIKSLTVFAKIFQVLSLIPDLLKAKIPSLCNLKSLKVKLNPPSFQLDAKLEQNVSMLWKEEFSRGLEQFSFIPDGIVDSLLQDSRLAEVDIIELIRLL